MMSSVECRFFGAGMILCWLGVLVAGVGAGGGRALVQQENNDAQKQQYDSIPTINLYDLDLNINNNQGSSKNYQVDLPSTASIVELLQHYNNGDNGQKSEAKKQENYYVPKADNYDNLVNQKSTTEISFLSKLSNIEVYPTKILQFTTLHYNGQKQCSIQDQISNYNSNCGNNNKPCLFQFEKYIQKIISTLKDFEYISGTFFVPQDSAFEKLLSDDKVTQEILMYHLIPRKVVLPKGDKNKNNQNNGNNAKNKNNNGDNAQNGGQWLGSLVADRMVIPIGPMLNSTLGNLGDLIINSKGGIELWGNPAEVLKPNLQFCSLTIHIVEDFLLPQQIREKLQGSFVQDVMQPYSSSYIQAARVATAGIQIPLEQQQQQQQQNNQQQQQQYQTPPQNSQYTSNQNNSNNHANDSSTYENQNQGVHIDSSVVAQMFSNLYNYNNNNNNNNQQEQNYVKMISASDIGLQLPPSYEQQKKNND